MISTENSHSLSHSHNYYPDPEDISEGQSSMILTRNKRDEFLIDIRKKKNSNLILQKRIKLSSTSDHKPHEPLTIMQEETPRSSPADSQIDPRLLERLQIERDNFYNHLKNQNYEELTTIVTFLRICTIDRPDPENIEDPEATLAGVPGRYIMDLGIVPELIGLLSERFYKYTQLQVECAWLLTNLSADSGDVIYYLAQNGIIRALAQCFRFASNQNLHENAIWALANISGEKDLAYRDEILEQDVLNLVVKELYKGAKSLKYYEISAWLISNLVRGRPHPPFNKIAKAFGALSYLVDYEDYQTKCFALQSLIYLTEVPEEEHIKSFINNDLMQKVFKCLINDEKSEEDGRYHVTIGAVKIMANFANVEGALQKDQYKSLLRNISDILKRDDDLLREEICKLLRNLLGVYSENYDYAMDYEIMSTLLELIAHDQENVKIQATSCLCNYLLHCSTQHAMALIEKGLVNILLENLQAPNSRLIEHSLKALFKVLSHGNSMQEGEIRVNPLVMAVKQEGMQGLVENLQQHPEMNIRTSAAVLWDRFFDDYYEEGFQDERRRDLCF